MQSNEEANPPKQRKLNENIARIRDIAILVACAAAAYSFLAKPGQQQAPEVQLPKAQVESALATPPQTLSSIEIKGGVLTLGNDEASTQVKNYLKNRVDTINMEGPVVLKEPKRGEQVPSASSSVQTTAPAPYREPPAVQPVVRSDVQAAGAAITTPSGTVHPAPFVDKVAQASIEEIAKKVLASKGAGVAQLGLHLDGSPMTRLEKQQQVRETFSKIPDEWTITYKSPNEKVRLYVFTDTTCPFCHKLHNAMGQLLDAGISVHYLLYPRDMGATPEGSLSRTAVNMKNIWCSVDQHAAMDSAFEGYRVPDADCSQLPASLKRWPAPVPDHYLSGNMYNVTATPTWYASNGIHDVGFNDAQSMIRTILGQ